MKPDYKCTAVVESQRRRVQGLKAKATAYSKAILLRKEALRQHEAFCQWLLKEKRYTKEEMRPFFKRISEVRNGKV